MLKLLVKNFWSESVWLPANLTWDDIAPGPDKVVNYNELSHVWYPIPIALGFIILRFGIERGLLIPFGKNLGLYDAWYYKAPYNPRKDYRRSPNTRKRFSELAKGLLDQTKRVIGRWLSLRHVRGKSTRPTLKMFCKDAWKVGFYICNFLFGLYVLWDKSWLWDIDQCYVEYPNHGITNDVWWYYMISSAFYWSLMIDQLWRVGHNDFWQVHYIATIALLSCSWVCNLHRIGTLVLLCHNLLDILVELVKYINFPKLRAALFLMFTVTWIGTRIFPFYIIWSTTVRAPQLMSMFPAFHIFNTLLCLLHILWTWLILFIVHKAIKARRIERDCRIRMQRIMNKPVPDFLLSDTSTPKHNKENWNELSLQKDVNEHVDMAISQLVPYMQTYRLDPMDLPDVDEGSEFKLKIHGGFMTGLSNVARSGDQRIKYFDNKLNIQLQFQITKLEFVYTYLVQVMNIGPSGELVGSLDRFTIAFDLLIDFNNSNPFFLQKFTISDISELSVQLSGNILIDRLVNPVSQLFTNMFHKTIIDVVQSNIGSAIQDALDFTNTNIKDIIQSIILNVVFQSTIASNAIADRYLKRRRNANKNENRNLKKSK